MGDAITIGQLIVAAIVMVATILIPVVGGLFNIMKSINQTNTRLDHIEKNWDDAKRRLDMIPVLEQRVTALESFKKDTDPALAQLIQMLGSIDAKLDITAKRIDGFEKKFEKKFEAYDTEVKKFYEKYSGILNEKK